MLLARSFAWDDYTHHGLSMVEKDIIPGGKGIIPGGNLWVALTISNWWKCLTFQ